MKLTIFGLTVVAGAALIIAGLHGQLDWTSTPAGHAALAWLLFAVLVTVLACLAMRTRKRDRAKEVREHAAYDVWEDDMGLTQEPVRSHAVRRITDAEMAAESDRMWDELEQGHKEFMAQFEPVPAPAPVVAEWPTRQTPMLLDLAPTYVRDAPLVRWDPAYLEPATLLGRAASFASDMRDGVHVYDEDTHARDVLGGLYHEGNRPSAALAMSQAFGHVVDAMPVSPAPNGGPRHRKGHAPGTQTQQARERRYIESWEQADWEQPTGAFPVLQMAGAS